MLMRILVVKKILRFAQDGRNVYAQTEMFTLKMTVMFTLKMTSCLNSNYGYYSFVLN